MKKLKQRKKHRCEQILQNFQVETHTKKAFGVVNMFGKLMEKLFGA